jgi:AcrR family transcriptional regulator
MAEDTAKRAPVRRARGLARIEAILDAAASEFADVGYDRATTNSIAARAGISPGSLYQYFSGKEAIADALAERYAATVAAKQSGAFGVRDVTTPELSELVRVVVDPIIQFNIDNPGLLALFARTDLPERLANPIEPVEETFASRLREIVTQRNPGIDPGELARVIETLILMFRGLMKGISALDAAGRERRAAETRAAIVGYLAHRGIR